MYTCTNIHTYICGRCYHATSKINEVKEESKKRVTHLVCAVSVHMYRETTTETHKTAELAFVLCTHTTHFNLRVFFSALTFSHRVCVSPCSLTNKIYSTQVRIVRAWINSNNWYLSESTSIFYGTAWLALQKKENTVLCWSFCSVWRFQCQIVWNMKHTYVKLIYYSNWNSRLQYLYFCQIASFELEHQII